MYTYIDLSKLMNTLFFSIVLNCREYPCDHYTSVINVTVLMTGCPRVYVHTIAVQLLQVLDKRFFGNVGPLQTESEKGKILLLLIFIFPKWHIEILLPTFNESIDKSFTISKQIIHLDVSPLCL